MAIRTVESLLMEEIVDKIKVSIITPCLNSAKTIRQTIESVLYQTYTNIEYIIVDGMSTDGTIDIIREYVPLFHGRMRYISEKDNGIYDAMNKGIKLSKGKLIGIINSDDFYDHSAVENIVSNMSHSEYQVIYGYCRIIDCGHAVNLIKYKHQQLRQMMISHPTCFVTRKTYQKFGMFLTGFKLASDYELMLRLYDSGKVTFIQLKKVIANFRLGGKGSNFKKSRTENLIIRHHYKIIPLKKALISVMKMYLFNNFR